MYSSSSRIINCAFFVMKLLSDSTRTILGILFSPNDTAVTTTSDVLKCVNIFPHQCNSIHWLENGDLHHTIN
jgi:hypothetical protein